jgi:cephalosporin-C deacetylase-like acetyl esterase
MNRNRNKSLIPSKGGDPLDIHHFFSTIGDKISKVFGFNPVLENSVVMKTAIIPAAISMLISSVVLVIPALSHYRFKKSIMPVKSNSKPTLPK